jgi:hypothetical protein
MAKTLQLRRGTTAEISANTPAAGELFVDLDKKIVTVGDGSTPGGTALAKQSGYLANTILISNSSGYLSNTANLQFENNSSGGGVAAIRIKHAGGNLDGFLNVATLSVGSLYSSRGSDYTTDVEDLYESTNESRKIKFHGGLNGGVPGSTYGGRNTLQTRTLYANTSDATIVYASALGNSLIPAAGAGLIANGEIGVIETTIIAQSHGAAGSNAFDGTKIWKYETTFSKTPTEILTDTISAQISNTGNSGTWTSNVVVNNGNFVDVAVQGEVGKNIFWYVTTTQKSLWCTFAQAGGGGGGGGK